jgi:GAF domain-containing protein
MVVDLSELLDLNEEGFAVRTAEKLEVNGAITLCLELPETKSYIHGSGQVIWSDDTGRSGVRFEGLTDSSRRLLKEWLLANLLIGSSNHAARTEQLARREREQGHSQLEGADKAADHSLVVETESLEPQRIAEIQKDFDAFTALDGVREEVRRVGNNADVVFGLITDRALHLLGAQGSALAFLTQGRMICRGSSGDVAPPLGTPVDSKQGLTGECVRSGVLISCEDTGNDPRVDPEVGRILGIGSLMAAPIALDSSVVGLLEVFFSQPNRFSGAQKTVLHRLVDMIPNACLQPRGVPETRVQEARVQDVRVQEAGVQQKEVHRAEVHAEPLSETQPLEAPIDAPLVDPPLVDLPPLQPKRDPFVRRNRGVSPVSVPYTFEGVVAERKSREQIFLEQVTAKKNLGELPGPSSPIFFRVLIGVTIVVVAVVVGYLIGPIIEKRWGTMPQPSQHFLGAAQASTPAARPQALRQVKSLAELRKLADNGDADAEWQLGVRYHNGEEVPHDDARAMLWFQRAADQGHVTAQATLGAYYWAGRGVPQDLSKAYFWSTLAYAQGDENSRSRIEGLSSQMTQSQVSSARQQAELWLRNHNGQAKASAN